MDASEVVTELKSLLDNSASLTALMGTQSGDTKVFIRNTIPQNAQFPLLLISDFAHAPLPAGQKPQHYNAAIDVTICAQMKTDGSDDLSLLHRIAALVDTIVESMNGTTDTTDYFAFKLQNAAAAQSLDNYSVKVITYQGKLAKI